MIAGWSCHPLEPGVWPGVLLHTSHLTPYFIFLSHTPPVSHHTIQGARDNIEHHLQITLRINCDLSYFIWDSEKLSIIWTFFPSSSSTCFLTGSTGPGRINFIPALSMRGHSIWGQGEFSVIKINWFLSFPSSLAPLCSGWEIFVFVLSLDFNKYLSTIWLSWFALLFYWETVI